MNPDCKNNTGAMDPSISILQDVVVWPIISILLIDFDKFNLINFFLLRSQKNQHLSKNEKKLLNEADNFIGKLSKVIDFDF